MVQANFSVIRVGESVWTTWEPEEGRFDLDWLQPVLDGAHARGIQVVLGTPTYAAPPWLVRRYPEIAADSATGVRVPWGARQEIDYTHPAFLFHAERVIRKIVARYADHPAVIGYQVDNEPGMRIFHNHGVFQRFVDELRHRTGRSRRSTRRGAWSIGRTSSSPGRTCGLRTATSSRSSTWPGVASRPSSPRVHRLAGRHRPRVRPRRSVRLDLHRLRPADRRRRQPDEGARCDDWQLLLRDAGRAGGTGHRNAPPGLEPRVPGRCS